jgi:hypothetical protein
MKSTKFPLDKKANVAYYCFKTQFLNDWVRIRLKLPAIIILCVVFFFRFFKIGTIFSKPKKRKSENKTQKA